MNPAWVQGVYVGRAKSTYFSPVNIKSIPNFRSKSDRAWHPTTGLCTRLLGFAPNYWALHPTTGLCTQLLGFPPNTELLTQTQKSSHSSDQRTLIGHFPLNPGPLLMAYSHVFDIGRWLLLSSECLFSIISMQQQLEVNIPRVPGV